MSVPWSLKGISSNPRKTFYDPAEAMAEILSYLTNQKNTSEVKRVNYLNLFVKLVTGKDIKQEDLGYTTEEILLCLRPLCFLESTKLKNATFRAVRHFVKTEDHVDLLIKLKYDFLVAREITAGGIQLCRRILVVAPHKLTHAPVRAIVAFAHPSHNDNLQSAALAFLAETALLNPSVFISCGGVSALIQPLPSLRSPKMTEALLGPLLYLANKPVTRHKSGLSLQCLTASVYMDPSFTSNKNNSTGNGHVKWSTTAILCLLRSWTGLLHLCQGKRMAITSIVNCLYVSHLQKPILEVLYDLLKLVQPEWTDEMSVALNAVSPSRWQVGFRISEGFVAAEASVLVPHLAKAGVNLMEVHRAVVLYLLLEANLLDAIVHVIVSDDTFLSVHATILLGEILHLIHTILPPELVSLTPGLPNLISYAVRGCPISLLPSLKTEPTGKPVDSSLLSKPEENLTFDDFLNPGLHPAEIDSRDSYSHRNEAQGRALSAILAMSCLHKKPPVPSLYLNHLISCLKETPETEEKPPPIAHGSCDDAIKESGVMTAKDPFTWNWDVIRAILKRHSESLKKATDSNRRLFLRRLVNFILPVTGQYGRKEIGSDRKLINKFTLAALSLISMLLSSPEETEAYKYLLELLGAIRLQLEDITTAKSAHDCLLSPTNISNSLCQDYFLFIGHLTRTAAGRKALEKSRIYQQLIELVSTTNQECYIKLIVSTLDYSQDLMARQILKTSLESKSIACRLYATKILHTLIRIGVGHDKSLMSFIIGLIVYQAGDPDRNVARVALDTLQEATHCKEYVEAIVDQKPCLLRHGDNGLLLLIRCLSTEQGFQALHQGNFVQGQLAKWGTHYNYRYVTIVESLLAQNSSGAKEVYLPPHLYQQLACHQIGLAMVLADPYVAKYIQVLEKTGDPETDEELLEMKAALYSLSGIASVLDNNNVVYNMVRIATTSGIYSLRAVAIIAVSNVATSPFGVTKLQALGWHSVRHNRHDRWPLVPSRTYFPPFEPETTISTSEQSEKSPLFDLPEESMNVEEQEEEDIYWGIPGGRTQRMRERRSATLPHNTCAPAFYHNRSFSESKAEQSDGSDYMRYEGGRKSRSNSYTDSSTSGDSTYGMRHHSVSERVQPLSPIPSTGSLVTYHPPLTRRMSILSHFSRNSFRASRQNMLRSLGQPTALPIGLITYGELQQLSPATRQKPVVNTLSWMESEEKFDPDFSTLDHETPDIISVQSASPEIPTPIYMGITLPTTIGCLFPKEEKSLLSNHVQFVSQNLRVQGMDDLKNPSFHREICFLGPKCTHNTMVNTSDDTFPSNGVKNRGSGAPQFAPALRAKKRVMRQKESEGQYIGDLEPLNGNSGDESSMSDVECLVEKPMPIIFKSPAVIRSELTRMVEQLSNPILHKTCKQSLLQIKQAHGSLFRDVCVFSDVCYVLSTCQVRIASREFLHELFENSFPEIWEEAASTLQEANKRRVKVEG